MTATTIPQRPRAHAPGVAFPILLIALGVYFYLSSTGVIAALRWQQLAAFWPIVIVIFGIDLLFRGRSSLVAMVLIAVVVALALTAAATLPALAPPATAQEVTIPLQGAQASKLDLSFGGGRLTLGAGNVALLQVRSDQDDIQSRVDRGVTAATLDIRQRGDLPISFGRSHSWDVAVAPGVPLTLDLKLGAGDFDVDLSGLDVTAATIGAGAADLRIVLPRPAGERRIDVSSGASSIEIDIPAGVQARIDTSRSGVSSVSGPSETAGYAAARDRVLVRVEAGASSVRVVQLP